MEYIIISMKMEFGNINYKKHYYEFSSVFYVNIKWKITKNRVN